MKKKAAIAIVQNENGQLLLAHSKTDSHDWGFPGGKVETNELMSLAIARELLEETGYECEMKPCYMAEDGEFEVYAFVGISIPVFISEHNEGIGRWGSIVELLNPLNTHFQFNLKMITELMLRGSLCVAIPEWLIY